MSALSFTPPKPVKLNGSRTYYFRLRVPRDLACVYAPRTEFKYSLKTEDRKEAQARIMLRATELEQEFREHRRRLTLVTAHGCFSPRRSSVGASGASGVSPLPSLRREFGGESMIDHDHDDQTSTSSQPTPCPPLVLTPFEAVTDTELERLALLYPYEALKADEAMGEDPEEQARARHEWQERQELFREIETSKGWPFTPEPFPETCGVSRATLEKKRQKAIMFLEGVKSFIARHDYAPVLPTVLAYLEQHGIQPPVTATSAHTNAPQNGAVGTSGIDPRFRRFCLAILRGEVMVQTTILKRLDGEDIAPVFVGSPSPQVHSSVPSVTSTINDDPMIPTEDNPPVFTVWERYLAERKPSPATIRNFAPAIRRFVELEGNLPVKAVTKAHIRRFKDALLKLPAYLPNALKELALPQLLKALAQQGKQRQAPASGETGTPCAETSFLSPKTINNKNLAALSVVFKHAIANGFIDTNPCTDIKAAGDKSRNSNEPTVLAYSDEDLTTIFQKSALFSPESCQQQAHRVGTLPRPLPNPAADKARLTDYRWFVLLALYTGARLEELGQLDLADVRQERGVWYIHIHDDPTTGRRIKNATSRRKMPLHPRILELGFLNFVHQRDTTNSKSLFATFPPSTDGKRTRAFSKWWERFTAEIGVKDSTAKKRFHSFRHAFKREMLNTRGVDKALVDCMQGHAGQGISAQYGRDEDGMQYALPTLLEALGKAAFGNVTKGLEQVMKTGE